MEEKYKYRIIRWLDILFLSVVAFFIFCVASEITLIANAFNFFAQVLGSLHIYMYYAVCFFAGVLIVLLLKKHMVIHEWRPWFIEFKYPPAYFSLFPFLLLVYQNLDMTFFYVDFYERFLGASIAMFSAIICCYSILRFFNHKESTRKMRSVNVTSRWINKTSEIYLGNPEKLNSHEEFLTWALKEEADKESNYFDRSMYVDRVAKKLTDHAYKSHQIAIVGEYGSGKSSICERVKDRLEGGNFIFIKVDGWGRKGDSCAAQILNVVIEKLSESVDCASLRSIPKQYMDVLSGTNLANGIPVFDFLNNSSQSDAAHLLKKIDIILCALDLKIVIVLEDFDRRSDESLAEIIDLAALMDRLRNLNHINFILCVGPSKRENDLSSVLSRISTYREDISAIKCHGPIKILIEVMRDVARSNSVILADELFGVSSKDFSHLLDNIITNPRDLKVIIRRTLFAWNELKGNVNINDLIVVNAVRFCAPHLLDFIVDNHKNLRSDKEEKFGKYFENIDKNIFRLIEFLFRSKGEAHNSLQRVAYVGDTDYLKIIYEEKVIESESSDQVFFKMHKENNDNDLIDFSMRFPEKYMQYAKFIKIELAYKILIKILVSDKIPTTYTVLGIQDNRPNVWSFLVLICQAHPFNVLLTQVFERLFEINMQVANDIFQKFFAGAIKDEKENLNKFYADALANSIFYNNKIIFISPHQSGDKYNDGYIDLYTTYRNLKGVGNESYEKNFMLYISQLANNYDNKIIFFISVFLQNEYVDRAQGDKSKPFLNPYLQPYQEKLKKFYELYDVDLASAQGVEVGLINDIKNSAQDDFIKIPNLLLPR